VGQDELPAADMTKLREAVLGFYEESVRPLVGQRRRRMARRLHRRGLRWLNVLLLLPWLLVGLVHMAVARRGPELMVRQQWAVSLYRQLSGKDPRVAEAEVERVKGQLLAIDQRVKPYGARLATAGATADQAELEAAAGALLAYHLGGRQTDDALLGQIQAAWVEYEAIGAERKDQMLGQVARGEPPSRKEVSRQERVARDRYLQPAVVLQVSFEAGPNRWPTLGCGEVAAPPVTPRRSVDELVAYALKDLGG
jgi:hypothetical protein